MMRGLIADAGLDARMAGTGRVRPVFVQADDAAVEVTPVVTTFAG